MTIAMIANEGRNQTRWKRLIVPKRLLTRRNSVCQLYITYWIEHGSGFINCWFGEQIVVREA